MFQTPDHEAEIDNILVFRKSFRASAETSLEKSDDLMLTRPLNTLYLIDQ
jgi:hypothetical protein